ncbi:MAG: helix-turn-helix transcriptional regulator [Bacilli bacterium]|jgi:transcriptional regulator with XRE-family HTH domain|nr:helix-turn-helix transcriptional regulator [Bacilli bacterium]
MDKDKNKSTKKSKPLDFERGDRLTKLREKNNLTQIQLYNKIKKFYGEEKKEYEIDPKRKDNGKQTISTAECGGTLSVKNAVAISHIFGVSLDYIYLGVESYKPSYDDIKELTGLNDDALNMLEKLKENDKTFIFVLNNFLGPNLSSYFINLLHSYFDYYNLNAKGKEMTNEYVKYIKSKGAKIKNIDDFSWEFYPKERDYTSLYKISTESNELANKFRKYGDK